MSRFGDLGQDILTSNVSSPKYPYADGEVCPIPPQPLSGGIDHGEICTSVGYTCDMACVKIQDILARGLLLGKPLQYEDMCGWSLKAWHLLGVITNDGGADDK